MARWRTALRGCTPSPSAGVVRLPSPSLASLGRIPVRREVPGTDIARSGPGSPPRTLFTPTLRAKGLPAECVPSRERQIQIQGAPGARRGPRPASRIVRSGSPTRRLPKDRPSPARAPVLRVLPTQQRPPVRPISDPSGPGPLRVTSWAPGVRPLQEPLPGGVCH